MTRDRALLVKCSAALIVVLLCITGSFYFLYRALGLPLPFSAVLVTLGVGNIATLVPITPGSLGIFDAVTIQIPLFFGLDVARAISATVLFRTIFFAWAFVLGIAGFIYLSVRVGRLNAANDAADGDADND
jgi:Mg2+-importing ATPase